MAKQKWQPRFQVGEAVLIDAGELGASRGRILQQPESRRGKYYVADNGFGRFIKESRLEPIAAGSSLSDSGKVSV